MVVRHEIRPMPWFKLGDNITRPHVDPEALKRLTQSVGRYGILQPPGAKPDGLVVWGNQRVLAAIAAKLKETTVAILDEDMTEADYLVLQMVENLQRVDTSQYGQFLGCKKLLELRPDWGNTGLAKYLGVDASLITRIMSPAHTLQDVQDAFAAGRLTLTETYAIAKAPSEQQLSLLEMALNGAGRDELEKARKKKLNAIVVADVNHNEPSLNGREPVEPERSEGRKRNGSITGVKPVRAKLALPSGISITVAGAKLDLAQLIEALAEAKQKAERARESGSDIKTIAADFRKHVNANPAESEV
jgi:ParB-like chromosome segregation protein Spo0J